MSEVPTCLRCGAAMTLLDGSNVYECKSFGCEQVTTVEHASPSLDDLLAGRPVSTVETINHPAHYGGGDNPYETIKVIEAWELGFCLGNAIKYISRAGKKHGLRKEDTELEDLRKARWYLEREIKRCESQS